MRSCDKETLFLPFLSFFPFRFTCPWCLFLHCHLFSCSHQIQIHYSCYSYQYLCMNARNTLAGTHVVPPKVGKWVHLILFRKIASTLLKDGKLLAPFFFNEAVWRLALLWDFRWIHCVSSSGVRMAFTSSGLHNGFSHFSDLVHFWEHGWLPLESVA